MTTRAVVAGDVLLSAPRSLLLSSDGALAGDLSFVAKCSRGSGARAASLACMLQTGCPRLVWRQYTALESYGFQTYAPGAISAPSLSAQRLPASIHDRPLRSFTTALSHAALSHAALSHAALSPTHFSKLPFRHPPSLSLSHPGDFQRWRFPLSCSHSHWHSTRAALPPPLLRGSSQRSRMPLSSAGCPSTCQQRHGGRSLVPMPPLSSMISTRSSARHTQNTCVRLPPQRSRHSTSSRHRSTHGSGA